MTNAQQKNSEACDLASKVANRYGKLALTRAAGEAAAAQRLGDQEKHDLWSSVVNYLRQTVQRDSFPLTA